MKVLSLFDSKQLQIYWKAGEWIYSFLQGRAQEVIENDKVSKVWDILSGVSQGSFIGPRLFPMVIDTIGDNQQNQQGLILSCFADDTKIALPVHSSHDAA